MSPTRLYFATVVSVAIVLAFVAVWIAPVTHRFTTSGHFAATMGITFLGGCVLGLVLFGEGN